MPNINVKQETIDTLKKKGIDNPAAFLDKMADSFNEEEIEESWKELSISKKKSLLNLQ